MDNILIAQNLSKNISKLRREKSLTQASLAKLSQLPRSNIAYMETGDGNPTITAVAKVAEALNVTVNELLSAPKPDSKKLSRDQIPQIEKSGGKVRIFKLLPEFIEGIEWDFVTLEEGLRQKGIPHAPYTKEYAFCLKGEIEIFSGGEKNNLKQGELLAFRGDLPHSYFNRFPGQSSYLSLVIRSFTH